MASEQRKPLQRTPWSPPTGRAQVADIDLAVSRVAERFPGTCSTACSVFVLAPVIGRGLGADGSEGEGRSCNMQEHNQRFAGDLTQLDADLGRAFERRAAHFMDAGQDRFLGEDSSVLRGLIAAMTFAGATARP